MKCHVCGLGPANGVTVYRQNETGVPGVWACLIHSECQVAPDVAEIVTIIERDNRDRRDPPQET